MKITTNYSKSDWDRFIPNLIVSCIPVLFFCLAVIFLYLPYLQIWNEWINFQTETDSIKLFIDYIVENNLQNKVFTSPDGWVLFYIFIYIGAAIFPMLLILRFMNIIPIKWIIKKLKIEQQMKLVVFVNGKPLTKFRQLLEK